MTAKVSKEKQIDVNKEDGKGLIWMGGFSKGNVDNTGVSSCDLDFLALFPIVSLG